MRLRLRWLDRGENHLRHRKRPPGMEPRLRRCFSNQAQEHWVGGDFDDIPTNNSSPLSSRCGKHTCSAPFTPMSTSVNWWKYFGCCALPEWSQF